MAPLIVTETGFLQQIKAQNVLRLTGNTCLVGEAGVVGVVVIVSIQKVSNFADFLGFAMRLGQLSFEQNSVLVLETYLKLQAL